MDAKIKKIISRGSFLSLFTFLLIAFALEISSAARANHQPCPAGTVSIQGHKCLLALTEDKVLTATIVMGSRMILDCQGHALLPSVAGTVDDATTPANEYTPAQPDLAAFFNETVDSKIQNCVIGTEGAKFDFGVYVLNSDNNAIKHNTINVRTVGVHFLNSSYNKLSENEITYGSEIGKGVHLFADSNFNIVEGNHVISTGDDETSFDPVTGRVNIAGKVRDEPGTYTPFRAGGGQDNPIHSSSSFYDLINLRVNGEVFQVPRVLGDVPDGNTIDGNVTEHQNLTTLATRQVGILVSSGTHNSIVAHNQISGGKYGIFNAGEAFNVVSPVPGTCSLSGNYCMAGTEVDCSAGEGFCLGQTSGVFDGRNKDNVMEENVLLGPFYVEVVPGTPSGGGAIQIQDNNVNAKVRGNTITGDLGSNSIPVGIGLSGRALETSTVERNTVSGATAGLILIQRQSVTQTASIFGAEVRLNDFTGNGTNVKAGFTLSSAGVPQPTYTLDTELSVDGQGNFWGHTCAESNGFIEFGLPGADSDDADVFDSHAYGESVALQDPVTATVCPVP